jgi:hypothetical protein
MSICMLRRRGCVHRETSRELKSRPWQLKSAPWSLSFKTTCASRPKALSRLTTGRERPVTPQNRFRHPEHARASKGSASWMHGARGCGICRKKPQQWTKKTTLAFDPMVHATQLSLQMHSLPNSICSTTLTHGQPPAKEGGMGVVRPAQKHQEKGREKREQREKKKKEVER